MDSIRIERRAAAWLARRDGEAWDATAQTALEQWLAQDIAHRVAFLRLESAWEQSARLKALGAGIAHAGVPPRGAWNQLASGITPAVEPVAARPVAAALGELVFSPRTPPRRARWPLLAVAAMLVVAVAGSALFGWSRYAVQERASYASQLGALRAVALSDGSQATLSSDSRIDIALSRAQRRIDLKQGEAYFEVAKDAGRPFVVGAGTRRAVAVGTRFSVRRDGSSLRVVVTEGTVRLESDAADGRAQPTTLLPAGSIAIAGPDGVLVRSVSVADAQRTLDWRSGLLTFEHASLRDAVAEFNRYNTRKLVIGDAGAAALQIAGTFQWSNTDGFVRLLERGFPVRAEHRADQVVLHSR
ncbi:FecR domain-containing protein [Pseudoxanthomonas sp.]|uniref:FecR family protein n=1 Tax=Pseudoxanthomonas sp. TaxID=1871049 RepID=UPI0026124F9C|nr:FecR domain-containing protein [Pseudoxanthomonas sp.]WDS34780.1 MAG: FecR domain-containing protein [Pseudoxanthomonas sp.]